MDTALSIISILGPFFSMSRLIGLERARVVELYLLSCCKSVLTISFVLVKLGLRLILIFILLLILLVLVGILQDLSGSILINSIVFLIWLAGFLHTERVFWMWGWDVKFFKKM